MKSTIIFLLLTGIFFNEKNVAAQVKYSLVFNSKSYHEVFLKEPIFYTMDRMILDTISVKDFKAIKKLTLIADTNGNRILTVSSYDFVYIRYNLDPFIIRVKSDTLLHKKEITISNRDWIILQNIRVSDGNAILSLENLFIGFYIKD